MPENLIHHSFEAKGELASETVLYFAYGSNMSNARLVKRVAECGDLGPARLAGHVLRFNMHAHDGSAKCNAVAGDDDSEVIGVLYRLDRNQLAILDGYEGADRPGGIYTREDVQVVDMQGRSLEACIYFASPQTLGEGLAPYDWYKAFVLEGARSHGIAEEYIARYIASVDSMPDPDAERAAREHATLAQGRS